ncbi:hypothetical protein ACHAWF_006212 [Thalassiosira exigua]
MDQLHQLVESGAVEEDRWERIRVAVERGDIPSAVADSRATLSCGMTGDPYIHTDEPSGKMFHMPDGNTAAAANKSKLHHEVRGPSRTVDMVHAPEHNSLLSTGKFAEAGYATLFLPDETWLKAIKGGNFASWPHLTEEAVRKNFLESDAQGHMKGTKTKQDVGSTKPKREPDTHTLQDGTELTLPLKKHSDIYISIEEAKETMYTDQTGAIPVQSRRGNRGCKPKKQILDNEASEEYKQVIREQGIEYELVPKGQHRQNIAEWAIQTYKSHAIGVLSGLPPSFPLSMWEELPPRLICK